MVVQQVAQAVPYVWLTVNRLLLLDRDWKV